MRGPWVDVFSAGNGNPPVVILGAIVNRTSEHINAQLFLSDPEKNLLNAGKVKFVAGKQQRQELREEKQDQAENASRATAKPRKEENGADFMLQGSINSVKDEISGKYVILYQVNLELVDLTTNEKAWIGQKEIKKSFPEGLSDFKNNVQTLQGIAVVCVCRGIPAPYFFVPARPISGPNHLCAFSLPRALPSGGILP